MGGGSHYEVPEGPATAKQMHDARLPIYLRDACAHILIPLNRCRYDTWFAPWECSHLRHEYEKCEHLEWLKRSKDPKVVAAAKHGHH